MNKSIWKFSALALTLLCTGCFKENPWESDTEADSSSETGINTTSTDPSTSSDTNDVTDTNTGSDPLPDENTAGDSDAGTASVTDTDTVLDTESNTSLADTGTSKDTDTTTELSSSQDTDPVSGSDTDTSTDSLARCSPSERRCYPEANQPQLCDAAGIWQDQPSCRYICLNGFCEGECHPTEKRCDTSTGIPQLCNSMGRWEIQSVCHSDTVCSAGECICTEDLSDCGGSCVALQENPDHCGACGHSCLGGNCVDGECQPIVMADDIDINSFLAISDAHVYELNDSNMLEFYANRIPKHGGTLASFVTQEANTTTATASADGSIYWDAYDSADERGTIYHYPDSSAYFAEQLEKPTKHIVINNGLVYWDQIFNDHTEIFAKPTDSSEIAALVVYSDYVIDSFTVARDCLYVDGVNHLIRYCTPTDTGTILYSAPSGLYIQDTPSESNYVYFRSIGEGIFRISTEPSSAQPELVTSVVSTDVVVAEDGTLYYIDGDSGGAPACTTNWGIYKLDPLSPNTPVTLIPPPMACPGSLKVDTDALYWINYDASALMKLAR